LAQVLCFLAQSLYFAGLPSKAPATAMPDGDYTPGEYLENNSGVLVWLLLVVALVLSMFIVDRRWQHRQHHLEKVTGIMNQSHAFSLNMVRHFMPSFKVQKYQFRGMQAKAGTADIEFKDLSLALRNGTYVLQGVSGEFQAGRLCAIMGPSGAGKTTFMNVLCGKATYGKMGGQIFVNGKEADISQFKSVTGFVPQDDIVHNDLTVREQIEFSAMLRNSVDTKKSKIQAIAQDVLNVMQIDHIQNSIVGSVEQRGISGGQRKRVNIGLELAAQPTVLFLDEPTSGLDSTSSLAVALSLKKMCQLGMTSIMVIHQPRYSLFTLFDDVLLLGKGGQTAYLGSSLGAKTYFESLGFRMPENDNPADWFMDVLSGEVQNPSMPDFRPAMLFDAWKSRGESASDSSTGNYDNGGRGREMNSADDHSILAHKLEEEWDRVDRNKDGVMDADELCWLLGECSTLKPTTEVVGELMERMAGKGAASVTKKQFLDYLCSLSSDVAKDPTFVELDKRGVLGPHQRTVFFELEDMEEEPSSEADSQESGRNDIEFGRGQTAPLDPLSGLTRDIPGFANQFQTLILRRLVQWWRMNRQRTIFAVALVLGGVILAVLDRFLVETPRWSAMSLLNLHTCIALLLAIFCLQVFGADQPVFWRESASGMNVFAYFQSRLFVNGFDIVVLSFLFTATYFAIRQPGVGFMAFFVPFLLTGFAASGWGYFISTVVPPKHGPFIVSLIIFIICGLLGNPSNLVEFLEGGAAEFIISAISITRWSIQMNFVQMDQHLSPAPEGLKEQSMLQMNRAVFYKRDVGFSDEWGPIVPLVAMGVVLRAASFLGLKLMNRDKQV